MATGQSAKMATRSRQDQQAVNLLEERTFQVKNGDTLRYAMPLLRIKNAPPLRAPIDAVMPTLQHTERRLAKDPAKALIYEAGIKKLIHAGCVRKLSQEEVTQTHESWFILHNLVEHSGKHRLVFNCSFSYQGLSLNDQLTPGPALGPSLLWVLLRFRQYAVAVSGDIRAIFHQVCLLPEDQPLVHFAWRNLKRNEPPDIYQWKVLPFGTTSSPCCATFALQGRIMQQGMRTDSITVLSLLKFNSCRFKVSSAPELQRYRS